MWTSGATGVRALRGAMTSLSVLLSPSVASTAPTSDTMWPLVIVSSAGWS